jgi:hypothetical protein
LLQAIISRGKGHAVQNIDFAHRIEKVRARMEAQGLDVLVATKLGSRHYLAGALVPWLRIPREVARESAMMSPSIPI